MVETLALRIAQAIKRVESDKTASIAVMKFALEALINACITLLLIALIGIATGSFGDTMLGFGAFAVLRFFSGGLHLNNAMHCSLASAILISIAPHIPLPDDWILIISAVSFIIVLILAPANIEGHARIPRKYFSLLKLLSALIVASNFFALSSTLCLVFAIQALTLFQLKKEVRI